MSSPDKAPKTLMAALYAGATYADCMGRLLDPEELDAVSAERSAVNKTLATKVGYLALLVTNTHESREAVRAYARKMGEEPMSHGDLELVGEMLDHFRAVFLRDASGRAKLVSAARKLLDLDSIDDRRATVCVHLENVTDQTTIADSLRECAPEFAGLKLDEIADALKRFVPEGTVGGKNEKGESPLGLYGVAATLSVAVGAVGDADVDTATERFRKAYGRYKKKSAERQAELQKGSRLAAARHAEWKKSLPRRTKSE